MKTENSFTNSDTSSLTNPTKSSVTTTTRRKSFSAATSNPSFLMKLLPHRRRQTEEVKKTSFVLDDYANLLSRDSNFLASQPACDAATVCSATASLSESLNTATTTTNNNSGALMAHRPSIVSVASVGSFQRQEVSLGELLGKGQFSKVYAITSIELEEEQDLDDAASNARSSMSRNARAGKYAMKRLRKKLLRRPRDFTRAAATLVIEAQYLSRLDHPNIIKLRGSALGGASSFQTGEHDGYFLILDRVTETLQERIYNNWQARRDPKKPALDIPVEPEILYQKTHYALQLASAIHYLHDRRIIFRDLKPANLGFTDEHSLTLYDFGLARDLPQALGLSNELFHMTQNAGTKPYTAVEVATTGLYNLKADVYSFAMVVYELMMEQMPFAHLAGKGKKPFSNNKEYIQAVLVDGDRPSFELEESPLDVPTPPEDIQDLLAKCWDSDLFRRPNMDDVFFELRSILEKLPGDHDLGASLPPAPKTVLQTTNNKSFADLSELTHGV